MNPKVIPFNFRDPSKKLLSSDHSNGDSFVVTRVFTREETKAWAKMAPRHQTSFWPPLFSALCLHILISVSMTALKKPLTPAQDGGGGSARVTLLDGSNTGASESGTPEPQPYPNKPVDAPVITGPSTSASRAQSSSSAQGKKLQQTKNSAVHSATRSDESRILIPIVSNTETPPSDHDNSQQETKKVQSKEPSLSPTSGIGFSRDLEDLLPNSDSQYVASQRRIGSIYGKGAVGGDLADVDTPTGYSPPDTGEVKVTRYDYAAYFLSLDRRFTEAWGGTRTLPPGSQFVGTVGEFIEYDIVINRNGTLSKIINVSQKEQPGRDFSAVDQLVETVFLDVFPLNPVPERIREDPLILRKRIQFTGYRLFFY